MLIKKFPAPSRIDYVASPYEPNEDGVMDVGFYNGALSDGRAYRLECWRMDEMLMMTVMCWTPPSNRKRIALQRRQGRRP